MSTKKTKKTKTKKKTIDPREFQDCVIRPDEDPLEWAKYVCKRRTSDDDASENVRNAAIVLIVNILQNCKSTPDRTTAITRVREALMYAESAIELAWEGMA